MSFARVGYYLAASIPLHYIAAVLFGAPLLSHFEDTFVFALVLSIFTICPLVWSCGSGHFADETLCNLIFEARAGTRRQFCAYRICVGSYVGAFVGTVVIPLDWDVYWQWPIPCIIGTLCGSILGALYSQAQLAINRGKIVDSHSKLI